MLYQFYLTMMDLVGFSDIHYSIYRIYSRIRRQILDEIWSFILPFDLYAGHKKENFQAILGTTFTPHPELFLYTSIHNHNCNYYIC